jgi:hypothetical protein
MAAALSLATTAFSIYASNSATKYANKAATAEMQARRDIYDRNESNQRNALKTNSRIRLDERNRTLSELRVNQAASGFGQSGGTQLAIFGDFKSRLDDQIDEATNQGLDQIAQIRDQRNMDAFLTGNQISQRKYAGRMNSIAMGISGLSKASGLYKQSYESSGSDPFSIFS